MSKSSIVSHCWTSSHHFSFSRAEIFLHLSVSHTWMFTELILFWKILIYLWMIFHHLSSFLYRGSYVCIYFPSSLLSFHFIKGNALLFYPFYFISFLSIFTPPFSLRSLWIFFFCLLHLLLRTSTTCGTLCNLYPVLFSLCLILSCTKMYFLQFMTRC